MPIRSGSPLSPIGSYAGGLARALTLSILGCAVAGPSTLPAPSTSYRAEVDVEITDDSVEKSRTVRVVEHSSMGRRRREMKVDGADVVTIDRPDLGVRWKLDPKAKSFEEQRIGRGWPVAGPVPDPFGPNARARFERLGDEVLDGVAAVKFAVKGEAISGFAWVSADGVPVRFSGRLDAEKKPLALEVVYTKIERGPQEGHLFGIPTDYAGYERRTRMQKRSSVDVDNAVRSLEETPPPMPPPSLY